MMMAYVGHLGKAACLLAKLNNKVLQHSFGNEVIYGNINQSHFLFQIIYLNIVALLFYVHGKHLRSCRDGQLT